MSGRVMIYDNFHAHNIQFGKGRWVFFFTRHLGPEGPYSRFFAARDGTQVYANSSVSLKALFQWVREWESYIGAEEK